MCGIIGYSGEDTFSPDKIKFLLYYNSMERGKDSTGIFTKNMGVVKTVQEAKNFISSRQLEPENLFIGHVRSRTVGVVSERNAHPFDFDSLVGVMNGTIENINSIATKHGFKTTDYQVDSEALYAILNKTLQFAPLGEMIGGMALLWYYKEKNILYVYRNDERPLYYGRIDNGIYISSIKESLDSIGCKDIVAFDTETVYIIRGSEVNKTSIVIPKAKRPIVVNTHSQQENNGSIDFSLYKGYWFRPWGTGMTYFKDMNDPKTRGYIDFQDVKENLVFFKLLDKEYSSKSWTYYKVYLFANGDDLGVVYLGAHELRYGSFINNNTINKEYLRAMYIADEDTKVLSTYNQKSDRVFPYQAIWITYQPTNQTKISMRTGVDGALGAYYWMTEDQVKNLIPLKNDEEVEIFYKTVYDFTALEKLLKKTQETPQSTNLLEVCAYVPPNREIQVEEIAEKDVEVEDSDFEELEIQIPETEWVKFTDKISKMFGDLADSIFTECSTQWDIAQVVEQYRESFTDDIICIENAYKEEYVLEEETEEEVDEYSTEKEWPKASHENIVD